MLSRERKRQILIKIAPPIMYAALRILYALTRHRFHINEHAKEHNFIGAFWHGELLMLPFLYKRFQKVVSKERDKGFYIVQSHHFDAELLVRVIALFGLKTLRGSSSKGGLRVLMEALKLLKGGCDIGMSPDGPKGPYHSISDGIVVMSQKAERYIVPIRVVYSRYWELKTWDKFRIPKPFSRVDYHMLDGFVIDKNMNLQDAKNLVRLHLEKEL